MNDEVGKIESVSMTGNVGMGGRERENSLRKLDMTGHKGFF